MNNKFQQQAQMQGSESLDDENIIRLFAKGEKKFVFNQNLQLEPQINVVTLKDCQGKIVGVMKINCKWKFALINYKADHLELINNIFAENNFVGLGDSKKQPGFLEYQQYDVPAGYKINCTTPKVLWKTWWPCQRFNSQHNIKLNILMLLGEKWYPIKDIIVHEGTFTIKTLIKEIPLKGGEKVIWINKLNLQNENAAIPVAERCLATQNFIAEQNTQLEKNASNSLSPQKDELFKQLLNLEASLKQRSIEHQNEIAALQRKHSEELNQLRQQMLRLRQSIERLEVSSGVEETLTETSTRQIPQSLLNLVVADESLEARENSESTRHIAGDESLQDSPRT